MKCPDCKRPLTTFYATDGSHPPAARPGDVIPCHPNGCYRVWTLREDGSLRGFSSAEWQAVNAHFRAKEAECSKTETCRQHHQQTT